MPREKFLTLVLIVTALCQVSVPGISGQEVDRRPPFPFSDTSLLGNQNEATSGEDVEEDPPTADFSPIPNGKDDGDPHYETLDEEAEGKAGDEETFPGEEAESDPGVSQFALSDYLHHRNASSNPKVYQGSSLRRRKRSQDQSDLTAAATGYGHG